MGASDWKYFVPYQQDLNGALGTLRQEVFESGEYWWYGDSDELPSELRTPRPTRLSDVFEDEVAQEAGTHSVLDVFRVLDPAETRDWFNYNTVIPATADELRSAAGTDRPTRSDVAALDETLERSRWVGRFAVLYDEAGEPSEIVFWGHSGD